ncbi:MAG: acyltransferase [Rickettsiales bacterium]|nr:acyltransferase [Rickettsiales bacterium]
MSIYLLKQWVRTGNDPIAALIYRLARSGIPSIRPLQIMLYHLHVGTRTLWTELVRIFYYTPLFQARLARPCQQLYLYSGLPFIMGSLQIKLGNGCRISGRSTLSGRPASKNPILVVGDNCDIGWQTTIAVGTKVELQDHVRLSGNVFLAGYPGHPLDDEDRAAGLPCTEEQIGDIVLEEGVWLATGVTVLAGVRIGKGSIIGAGSVVTKDIPAGVVAAGVPARIVKEVEND